MGRWHRWTEEELEIIRRDFRHSRQSCIELAERISRMSGDRVTNFAVRGQVAKMGICKNGRKPWFPEEDEKLRELMGKYWPGLVAKKMKRSINSVVVRSKRLKISRSVRDSWFTKREACEILGVDHHWIQSRIDCGALKASWHGETKPCKNGGSCWHIGQEDLREFIRRYPQELVGRNLDIIMVVEILAGIDYYGGK